MRPAHHDATNSGIVSVPHGPEHGDDHASLPSNFGPDSEKEIFAYILHPDDSFTPEGVYWADLPWKEKLKFVGNNAEAKEEIKAVGRMVKKDPLSPVSWYFKNAVLPGAGLGLEGYVWIDASHGRTF